MQATKAKPKAKAETKEEINYEIPPPPAYCLYAAMLDASQFEYRTRDIAQLLKINIGMVRAYCQQTWPNWEGQYLMDFEQAAILLYKICRSARNIPRRDDTARRKLFNQLLKRGIVENDFPRNDARIAKALHAIEAHRAAHPKPNRPS